MIMELKDKMGLDEITKNIGKAVDKVPELYEDGMKETVQETGNVVALIPKTIKAALAPLRIWIAQREYNVAETEKLLEQKLEKVDYNKIVSPEPYVAVPAIQAISYSMNSSELRNLYANLIAKAMVIDTKDNVHPSFVEIIKQISPLDSLVFKRIMEREANPMINLIMKNADEEYRTIITNITDLDIDKIDSVSVSIDNLLRLKLIQVPEDSFYTNERVYTSIVQTDFYETQKNLNPTTVDGFEMDYQKKIIEKTNLGKLFYNICVKEF